MALEDSCCTCASLLSPPSYDYSDEKKSSRPSEPPRRLPCCGRSVCANCMQRNPRFEAYCPFCQISSEPSSLPQGLRDPPAYTSPNSSPKQKPIQLKDDEPPAYASLDQGTSNQSEGVIHHLRPDDSISSLSLAYHVPASVLKSHNTLFSDHLLSARKTITIPSSHYRGPSLSADPVENEEETERKSRIRKFMMQTKCHDYNMAQLYLRNGNEDIERAVKNWEDDERWERENPLMKKGKGKSGSVGGGLTGQLR